MRKIIYKEIKNNKMKNLIILYIFILTLLMTNCNKPNENDYPSRPEEEEPNIKSQTYIKSEVYSSSVVNGKRKSNYRKSEREIHRSKKGKNPFRVRKYFENWEKRNGSPTLVKRKAWSNHPEERKFLDNEWRKTNLSPEMERVLIN